MYKIERVRTSTFFMINFFIVCLVSMFSLPVVKGNGLHTIIEEYAKSCAGKAPKHISPITEEFEKQFSAFIEGDATLAVEVDENGFFPIDLLILEIKKLGENGMRSSIEGNERVYEYTPVGATLFTSLVQLAEAMVKNNYKLHTPGIKIKETVTTKTASTNREYDLSPLGFLFSPVDVRNYTIEKKRTLQAQKGDILKLSLLEQEACIKLLQNDAIKKSIEWTGVTCIDATDMPNAQIIQSTPLHSAVQCNNKQLVTDILGKPDNNADKSEYINAVDGYGCVPLMRALYPSQLLMKEIAPKCAIGNTFWAHSEVFKQLLKYGGIKLNERCQASTAQNAQVANKTLLEVAVNCGFTDIVKALLDAGASVDVPGNRNGQNVFHIAAKSGNSSAVAALKEVVAKYPDFTKTAINAKDNDGNTPLHYLLTRSNCNEKKCKKFLDYGADLTIANKKGETPLHLLGSDVVRTLGGQDTAQKLFELFKGHAKANRINFTDLVNKKDNEGATLLDKLTGNTTAEIFLQKVKANSSEAATVSSITPDKQPDGEVSTGTPAPTLPGDQASVSGSGSSLTSDQQSDRGVSTGIPASSAESGASSHTQKGDPLKTSGSSSSKASTASSSQNSLSNRLVQGALVAAVGVGLFFALKRLFKQEKDNTEEPVGHE